MKMNALTSPPLIFLQLLADRKGNLSGLMFGRSAGEPDALLPLLENEDFLGLAGQISCLFGVSDSFSMPPALAAALQLAGCRPISDESLLYCNAGLEANPAPGAKWVIGSWYLAPPARPTGNQVASRAMALQLVQLVAADADTHDIEAVLRRDPALSYHLLRLVNSLGIGAARKISSFSQAILILGRQQLRRWLNLMLFAAREGDPRSGMLLARVAVRARAMELLARECGLDKSDQEQAFMAGMFSLLGVLFGMPLTEVLQPLTIGDALSAAVLRHEGDLGQLLCLVEAAETGDFAGLARLLEIIGVSPADFNPIVIQSFSWMLGVVRESQGTVHA